MIEVKKVPTGPENFQITVDAETARALRIVCGFGSYDFNLKQAERHAANYGHRSFTEEVLPRLQDMWATLKGAGA